MLLVPSQRVDKVLRFLDSRTAMMNPFLLKPGIQSTFPIVRIPPNHLNSQHPFYEKVNDISCELALTLPLMAGEKKTVTLEGTGL